MRKCLLLLLGLLLIGTLSIFCFRAKADKIKDALREKREVIAQSKEVKL